MKKLKHRLPAYATLDHLSLDSETLLGLKKYIQEHEHQFASVFSANKNLCGIHQEFADKVYENFLQIPLTDSPYNKVLKEHFNTQYDSDPGSSSITQRQRIKKAASMDRESAFNELTYIEKTSYYQESTGLFDSILSRIRSEPTRVRLVKLNAGTTVPPHIDYDPSYAVRVIIPIFSDKDCLNIFWVKNEVEVIHLREGQAYFLNTGYRHAVVNMSSSDRYTFMISLKGTADIESLLSK